MINYLLSMFSVMLCMHVEILGFQLVSGDPGMSSMRQRHRLLIVQLGWYREEKKAKGQRSYPCLC